MYSDLGKRYDRYGNSDCEVIESSISSTLFWIKWRRKLDSLDIKYDPGKIRYGRKRKVRSKYVENKNLWLKEESGGDWEECEVMRIVDTEK